VSYLDLETKWTVDYIRFAVRARIALRFPRHKLADDGTNFAPARPIATPK
jgi:phage tail sheath gpL-like